MVLEESVGEGLQYEARPAFVGVGAPCMKIKWVNSSTVVPKHLAARCAAAGCENCHFPLLVPTTKDKKFVFQVLTSTWATNEN